MKFRLKKSIRSLLAGCLLIAMILGLFPINSNPVVKEAKAASDVTVNLSTQYQEIMGYGGMNHPTWIGDLTSSQRETAFGNGDNQLGMQILRIWVDSDSNQWYKEVATAKAAIAKGAIVFATPWNPPSNLCETFTKDGASAKRLKHDKYYEYAVHLNNFVTYMKNNGVDLYAISCANEPDYGHDWTWWTETELFNFVRYYAQHIDCRVIAPESFSYQKSFSDAILNDSSALANVEIIGTHLYGTQYKNFAYPLFQQKGAGKQLWMTEVYYPNSNANSADLWPEALGVADHIHNAMVNNMQTYVWWYIRRSYSPMKEDGTISKRGYCMAQFSKFIRRGYKRVAATENPDTNIYVSAYTGDGKAVIVAVNKGDSYISKLFNVNGQTIKSVDRYRTSSSENLAKTSSLPLTGNGFWASLPANSVSTFVVTLAGSSSSGSTSSGSGSTVTTTTANISDGWYHLKNTNSGKYLQVTGNVGADGTNVEIGTGNGSDGQRWYVTNVGNGYVTLKNGKGYMLDVQYGENEDGTNIQTYSANGATAQQFKFVNTSTSGTYGITTRVSSDKKGLDVYNFSKEDGTNVCQWTYRGDSNQTWVLEPAAAPSSVSDGWYYIKNPNTQKYLTTVSNARGANVVISKGTGDAGQKWYVTNTSDGYVTLKNGYGYMLDLYYGRNEDGTNIQVYTANGEDAQKFKLNKTSTSGVYGITTKVSNNTKSLDIYDWQSADGTNVCQWTYYTAANQMWSFEPCN